MLRLLHTTLIPLQLRAAAAIAKGKGDVIELRSQDYVPLDVELHMAVNQVYTTAVGLLLTIESDDAVRQARNAFGSPPDDVHKDMAMTGHWMLSNVERALRVLAPNHPFDVFSRGQRLPNE